MNTKILNRNIPLSKGLEDLVDRKSRKVRRMLSSFRAHDLDLTVTLEKMSRGKQYQTTLVMSTPQTVLRVEDVKENLTTSVVRAFDELLRKIEKFKSQLNRERYWQKQPASASMASAPAQREQLENAINHNLEKIENYVRRELYHQALIQHFPPGVLQPQALVDQVFLEVSSRPMSRPENLSIEQWMFLIARDVITRNIQEIEVNRDRPHIEDPSEEQSKWDDEILNFYQPDEALRLEDLLSDQNSRTPEELLEREETEDLIQKAIARLPKSIRESFVLFALEGFNSTEVAMITGKPANQVLEDIENARNELRGFMTA